jgi:hypothetical protein
MVKKFHGKTLEGQLQIAIKNNVCPEPEFLNFEGAQESIPRNQFLQAV